MDKTQACLLASGFIGSSIYIMLSCKKCDPFIKYKESLNENQKNLYDKIVDERQSIYIRGTVLGVLMGLIYLYYTKMSLFNNNCIFASIILGVQYIYYHLTPKTDYMLLHLESKEQNEKWLQVYKEMMKRHHMGILLGIIGYFFLAKMLNYNNFKSILF